MPIARVTVALTFPGGDHTGTNTWHIRVVDNTPTAAIMDAAMSALEDYYTAIAANVWNAQYYARWNGESTTVEAEPENLPTGAPWEVHGSGAGTPSAAGVGLVVGWRTSLAGKSGRGRTFHAPIVTAAFDTDGTLTPAVLSFVGAAAQQLVDDSTASTGWAFGVYSPKQGVLRDITGFRIADKVAYLSSRRD